MDPGQLKLVEIILNNLQSEKEDVRKPAETQLNTAFDKNLSEITRLFSETILKSPKIENRSMAIILLRRKLFIGKVIPYLALEQSTKNFLKSNALKCIQNEASDNVRRQIVSLISDMADLDLPKGKWPELLPFLESLCKSDNFAHRADGFFLFGSIATTKGIADNRKDTFLSIFKKGMEDQNDTVRLKTFEALITFSDSLNEKDNVSGVLNALLKLSEDAIKARKEKPNFFTELLENLVDFVTVSPDLIKNHLSNFTRIFSGIAMSRDCSEGDRIISLESLVLIAEEDRGSFRRSKEFVEMSFKSALSLMVEFNDDENWVNNLDEEEIDESEVYSEGEIAMDRLAQSFGSERVLQVALPLTINNFLQSSEWKKRVVGLMAISQMAESIEDKALEGLVKMVSSYFNDSHPRVTYSAIHCIGQMCEDFSPTIQKNYHQTILPPLVRILKNAIHPKIQAHSGAALVNFVENIEGEVIEPYLKDFLPILFDCMMTKPRIVKEQVVTVVASMASSIPSNYHEQLEKFVPPLLENFMKHNNKEDVLYKAKCLESLTFIGMELPKGSFLPVAKKIMEVSLQSLSHFKEMEDSYYDFNLQAWIRLAEMMGPDFAPFLPKVMSLLHQNVKDEVDNEGDDLGKIINSDESDFNPINSHINELESTACALSVIPNHLGVHFLPHLQKTICTVEELLGNYMDENVRAYAARAVASLFHVASKSLESKKIGGEEVVKCLDNFIKNLLKKYVDEDEFMVRKNILTSLSELIGENRQVSQALLLSEENTERILKSLMNLIEILRIQTDKILENKGNTENDEEEIKRYENVLERENELLFKVTEVIGAIIKALGDKSEKIVEGFLNTFSQSLTDDKSHIITKKAGMLIVDDIILSVPRTIEKYAPNLINVFISQLKINDNDIRQAAIYGIGLLAEKFPALLSGKSLDLLKICADLHKHTSSQEVASDNGALSVADNAASAYGRIAFACSGEVDLSKSFPYWLTMLPLKNDTLEISKSSELLLKVVRSGDKKCLGANLENLPGILNIIAANFNVAKGDESQMLSIKETLRMINGLPAEIQKNLEKSLSVEAKKMIVGMRTRA